MKRAINYLILLLTFALAAWGCQKDPSLLDNVVGTWAMTSLHTKTYADGVLVSEETRNDSLPQWDLERTGQGFATDYAGVRDTFVWQVYNKEQVFVIYYRIGPYMHADITKQGLQSKELYWVTEFAEGTVMMKTEKTATIEKQ
jgi:hypothetical protein